MEIKVDELLRAAWLAFILPVLVASLPSRFSFFHGTLLGFAKRGKTLRSSSQKLSVPQRFFLHFYVLGVVCTTSLLLLTWFYAYKMVPFSMHKSHATSVEHGYRLRRSVFLLILMEIQVLRRLYETIYVFDYSPAARMHIFGYITGMLQVFEQPEHKMCLYVSLAIFTSYYTAAPLSLCSICAPEVFSFAIHQVAEFIFKVRDKTLVRPISEIDWSVYVQPFTALVWVQWIGAAIFIWGWIHQRRCHAVFGSLREKKEQDDKYVIPYGDWFRFVSSPHYLAEIVANLTFAAAETHKWYIEKFATYPSERRVILPYVY
ncbi:hypothetical protein C5167_017964 [Papaver somniferum]|uniref:3-oxo-5-alpha-steroid 4-dehydrogenase C-terminal domain-containing protein n=1 Tax=Papaver somniferum TaxID=3469 RepID=A0A4Y7INZ1_PAPSO|nr:hypothetical protein C5167_017964 [Papaver somniferum]